MAIGSCICLCQLFGPPPAYIERHGASRRPGISCRRRPHSAERAADGAGRRERKLEGPLILAFPRRQCHFESEAAAPASNSSSTISHRGETAADTDHHASDGTVPPANSRLEANANHGHRTSSGLRPRKPSSHRRPRPEHTSATARREPCHRRQRRILFPPSRPAHSAAGR